MKQLHTVPSLFESLRAIIPNLPESTISLDLHLDSREALPLMRVEAEVWREGMPVVTEGAIEKTAQVYRLVAVEPGEVPLRVRAFGQPADGMAMVELRHGDDFSRVEIHREMAEVLLEAFGDGEAIS